MQCGIVFALEWLTKVYYFITKFMNLCLRSGHVSLKLELKLQIGKITSKAGHKKSSSSKPKIRKKLVYLLYKLCAATVCAVKKTK